MTDTTERLKAIDKFTTKLKSWIHYHPMKHGEAVEKFFRENPTASAFGGFGGGYVMNDKPPKGRDLAEDIHEAYNRLLELSNLVGELTAERNQAVELMKTALGGLANMTPDQMVDAAFLIDPGLEERRFACDRW